jgi:2-succinyl-6-hydroxy-2,4-cyclohexadiene-1-carboxylate synthase
MSERPPITLWCLHGAVGMAEDWKRFADEMTALGIVFRAVDLWKYLDASPQSLEQTAGRLNAEASANPGTNILVGYSMGGRVALHALLEKSHPWSAAVIISAHPGLEDQAEKMRRREKDADWSVKCSEGDWETFLQEWQDQAILQSKEDQALEWGDRELLKPCRKAIARSFIDWSLGRQRNLLVDLARIDVPILFLTGERDQKFTELASTCVAQIPAARLQVIAACGHRVPWEQSEVFSQAVLAFVCSILPDPAC